MLLGSAFTKTWRIQNNGCQVWPNGTSLIYVSGNQMGGPASVPVPQTAVGGTQDVSVNLTTPGTAGSAQGKWQLRTPDGIQFGDKLTVKISAVALPPPAIAPSLTPTVHFIPLAPLVPIGPLLITANFTASFAGAKPCFIGTGYMVKVKNTGATKFESGYVKFEAPPGTARGDATSNDPFGPSNSCSGSGSSLDVDDTAYMLGGAALTEIPSGTDAKITLKLCGLDDLGGTCATKTVNFSIP